MDRFDRWARRRAGAGEAGLDRRELLRRAGVVGAVVAASPLIQSVSSPAFAAVSDVGVCSDPIAECGGPGCSRPKCDNGSACTTDSDCLSDRCTTQFGAGVCQPKVVSCAGPGATPQVKDQTCTSGYCERLTNNCTVPTGTGTPGSTCHGATQDVADQNCLPNYRCQGWSATSDGTCQSAA